MNVFAIIGGMVAMIWCFLRKYVPNAPSNVARLPKTTSHKAQPVRTLARIQPIKSPGIAAGVKIGRMVNASENLTCTAKLASPIAEARYVKTT